ncbi:oxidoreductase [Prauserella cavernicola]|uniref:oxidoreductase n=1 Tax=Prauserella cavernicola TaxID=2800127 RepID=UPI0027DD4370|nr:hypothetical protein [Prauserella cavernicola]
MIGQGYPDTPGLHSDEQIAAWRKVTDAVHAEGGTIFAQLMHTGRIGHPSLLPDGLLPVGPSAVAAQGQVFTHDGMKAFVTPKELTEAEIAQTITDFADAARNAIAAGFDGAELHGANGYLIHQFLAPNANLRTDGWGGSVASRIRLGVEVTTAVVEAIGGHRTGFRISPGNPLNDIAETDPSDVERTYTSLPAPVGGPRPRPDEAVAQGLAGRVRPQPVHTPRTDRQGLPQPHRGRHRGHDRLRCDVSRQP